MQIHEDLQFDIKDINVNELANNILNALSRIDISYNCEYYVIEISTIEEIVNYVNLDEMTQSVMGLADPIGQLMQWLAEKFSWLVDTIVNTLTSVFQTIANSIMSMLNSVIQHIANAVNSISSFISNAVNTISNTISNVFRNLSSTLTSMLTTLTSTISNFTSSILNALNNVFTSLTSTLQSLFTSLSSVIQNAINSVITTVSTTLQSLSQLITSMVNTLTSYISNFAQSITSTLQSVFTSLSQLITSTFQSLASYIQNMSNTILTAISTFMNTIVNTLRSMLQTLITNIQSLLGTLQNVIKTFTVQLTETVSKAFTGIASGIAQLPQLLYQNIVIPLMKSLEWITGMLKQVGVALMGFVNAILKFPEWFPKWFYENIAKPIYDALQGLSSWIWENMPDWLKTAIENISKFFTQAWNSLVWFFTEALPKFFTQDLPQFIMSIPQRLQEFAKWIWENLPEPIKQFFTTVQNFFSQAWDSLVWFFTKAIPEFFTKTLPEFITKIPQYIGSGLEWFYNNVIKPAIEWAQEHIVKPIVSFFTTVYDWLKGAWEFLTKTVPQAIGGFFNWLWENIQTFIKDPIGWIYSNIAKPIIDVSLLVKDAIWNALVGVFDALKNAFVDFMKEVSNFVKGLVDELSDFWKDIVDWLTKPIIGSFVEMFKNIISSIESPSWAEAFKVHLASISSFFNYLDYGLPYIVIAYAIPHALSGLAKSLKEKVIRLTPVGLGFTIRFKLTALIEELSHLSKDLFKALLDAFILSYVFWLNEPLRRVIYANVRNVLPVEIPTLSEGKEIVQRYMPTDKFKKVLEWYREWLALRGFADNVVNAYTKTVDELSITVKDRFDKERKFPIALMYDIPTASEMCRMMLRDMFKSLDDFTKVMKMRGMHEDIAYLFYLLHFKYPSPEKLWEFTMRGIAGELWFKPPKEVLDEAKTEAEKLGAYTPKTPPELNFDAKTLFYALSIYMKWHDMARFCVPEGEIILGDNKPIEEYRESDYTLFGGRVKATFKRYYKGKLVKIKGYDILEVKLTPEHVIPVARLARKWIIENGEDKFKLIPIELTYKHANEIEPSPKARIEHYHEGDYLLIPILESVIDVKELDLSKYVKEYTNVRRLKLPLDEDVAWFLGFYLAEGHAQEKYISVSQSEKKKEIIEKVCNIIRKLGYKPVISRHRGIVEIYVKSTILARAFKEWFGQGAKNKKIPDFILLHKNLNIVKAFLEGYIVGDGHIDEEKDEVYLYTTSKILALQLQLLLARLGYVASITTRIKTIDKHNKHSVQYIIRFRRHEHKNKWIRRLSEFKDKIINKTSLDISKDYLLIPVTEIEYEDYEGYVYDLEVENHHFLVSNVIVHNSWLKDYTADNFLVIDLLADIPGKIDFRWMARWGLFDYWSYKGIGLKTSIEEITKKLLRGEMKAEDVIRKIEEQLEKKGVEMDIRQYCRMLQARGLHPYWNPWVAIAETINALTEERTLLRTGFINLYKEGLFDMSMMHKLLAGFFTVTYHVGYFDTETMDWKQAKIEIPIAFLPAESKLLELRAVFDRAVDLWRDFMKEIGIGVRFAVLSSEEAMRKLKEFAKKINNEWFSTEVKKLTGKSLDIEIDEAWEKLYIHVYSVLSEIEKIIRTRYWVGRVLTWSVFRLAYGYITDEDVKKVIEIAKQYAKLTDYEAEALEKLIGVFPKIAGREYIPTPSQLATIVDVVPEAIKFIENVLKARRVPQEWWDVWKKYIETRPLYDELRSLRSALVTALARGVITEAEFTQACSILKQYGWTDREIEIMKKIAEVRSKYYERREIVREYIPTPTMFITMLEYVPEAIEKFMEVMKKRNVPQEWIEIWKKYAERRPIWDDLRSMTSRFIYNFSYGFLDVQALENLFRQLQDLGYTQTEIDLNRKYAFMYRIQRIWTHLIPSPTALTNYARYTQFADTLLNLKIDKMLDINILKQFMSETDASRLIQTVKQFYQTLAINRSVYSDVRGYIYDLLRAYEYRRIDDAKLRSELEWLKQFGLRDENIVIIMKRAKMRRIARWGSL